jgi:hypothetical protein
MLLIASSHVPCSPGSTPRAPRRCTPQRMVLCSDALHRSRGGRVRVRFVCCRCREPARQLVQGSERARGVHGARFGDARRLRRHAVPPPHRHPRRGWAAPLRHLRRDLGLTRATFVSGLGSPIPTSASGLGSPLPTSAPGLGARQCHVGLGPEWGPHVPRLSAPGLVSSICCGTGPTGVL